ncbi:MgtC/SapB family protein [Acinetobacter sp. S40]|uniref:MgtC/SapB family protein n=1 Tax=Acinetobacter sp. S40 TaxID=2767434 RepID=UPI00190DED2A|nr:MgtC/SapB family protein [Acinetobacter sp. S40]MBJ9984452.1 MgtC/SapB family protein [Acinetobacter sp. S40]
MTTNLELVARLLLAAVLGSFIGFERERLNWAAGLRTHMLVCVGSALIMLVSSYGFSDLLGREGVVLDPSRVAAQVVSGIGFLGAGSILLRGETVHGLTTAASLWSVAGIGLAVGGGMYIPAVGATVIILLILAGVKPLEHRFIAVKHQRLVKIVADKGVLTFQSLHDVLGLKSNRVKQFIVQQSNENFEKDEVQIKFHRMTPKEFDFILKLIQEVEGVDNIEY